MKADYVHLEVFFDPTAPLIGKKYDFEKSQLDPADDRLIEKGGLEFGFDFGYVSLYTAFSEGNMGIRAGGDAVTGGFGSSRFGMSFQYNYYKSGFYWGADAVELDEHYAHDFRVLKVFAEGPVGSRVKIRSQLIERRLVDRSDGKVAFHYDGTSRTFAGQVDWALTYRWTLYGLASLERRQAEYRTDDGGGDEAAPVHPKLASGVTVTF